MSAITVLGFGNILPGDDALGPHVIRSLQAFHRFDPRVSVREASFAGLDLMPQIQGSESLIVVDTVRAAGNPGTLRLYRRDEILTQAAQRNAPHQLGLREILLLLEASGAAPAGVLLIGVIPGEVESGIRMTREVEAAVARAEAEVVKELIHLGRPPVRSWAPAGWALSLEGSAAN